MYTQNIYDHQVFPFANQGTGHTTRHTKNLVVEFWSATLRNRFKLTLSDERQDD